MLPSRVRQRVLAYLSYGGDMLPCIAAHVHRTAERKGGSFHCTIPIGVNGTTVASWNPSSSIDTNVEVIFASEGQTKRMIVGKIDRVELNMISYHATVSGRDLAAKLAQTRQSTQHKNKKSSEIAKDIAKDVGLDAVVDETQDDAGKKYDVDTVHLILNRTCAETLNILAEREGFKWFVDGSTLYFQEKNKKAGGTFTVHYSPPTLGRNMTTDAVHIKVGYNAEAGHPVGVKVKSWHHKDKKLYEHTAQIGGLGSQLTHEHHFPGMRQDQVERIAKSHAKDAARPGWNVEVEMPGDLSANPNMKLQLVGTGTAWDQLYDVDSIEFEYEAAMMAVFPCASMARRRAMEGRCMINILRAFRNLCIAVYRVIRLRVLMKLGRI